MEKYQRANKWFKSMEDKSYTKHDVFEAGFLEGAKQRDELIECLKLAYENLSGNTEEKVFSKIEELLTKTQTQ